MKAYRYNLYANVKPTIKYFTSCRKGYTFKVTLKWKVKKGNKRITRGNLKAQCTYKSTLCINLSVTLFNNTSNSVLCDILLVLFCSKYRRQIICHRILRPFQLVHTSDTTKSHVRIRSLNHFDEVGARVVKKTQGTL